MASQIEKWVAEQTTARPDLKLRSVVETEALGTGGAVRHCLEGSAPWVMVLNGDSLQKVDLSQLGERIEREQLDGIIVAASQDDTSRYGALDIDENWTLRGFHEKRPGQGLINAGIYLFRRSALLNIPKSRPSSLETDVIPAMLASGAKIGVAVGQGDFLDIGTPESVMLAEDFIRRSFR
jgi:D-glycero-alpha-D-manno-heptose 1-phosphate guanylyltransferase